MNHTTFAVSRFENRNGIVSWRVDGRLHGVRIRKNFKTREEAAAEKAALELKAEQNASGLCPATTCLTNDQVSEASDAHNCERIPKSLCDEFIRLAWIGDTTWMVVSQDLWRCVECRRPLHHGG